MHDSVTKIGGCAFRDCSSLKSIKIPDGVIEIGWCVFEGCTSLREIRLWHKGDIKEMGDWGFADSGIKPEEITLYVPIGEGNAYRQHPYFNKFKEIKEK